ncbi:class I SAM-dependent methyltransferase [Umezawaea sp. NPDC059074]|uniref:class I SAM-dependent methyltransferase n=1 Tax=Umezawaea sp. NPDC059074 TaxID=3346716 RepID=UPI0036996C7B
MTHAPHHHNHDPHTHGQADLLDMDAEVLSDHLASIAAWLPVNKDVRHVVDLGSGTGAGTFALLAHFPQAEVTAVDASEPHLTRLRYKAASQGLTNRVHTIHTDLDADWPTLGSPDLIWASGYLHHAATPDQTLRKIHNLLPPGGLFALVEMAGFPRFLPPDAPEDRPGLEERCHAARSHQDATHVPHRGADWTPMLTAAGFTVENKLVVPLTITAKDNPAVAHYALTGLKRLSANVSDSLDTADQQSLARLLDTKAPTSLLNRPDLALRTERTIWAARRP